MQKMCLVVCIMLLILVFKGTVYAEDSVSQDINEMLVEGQVYDEELNGEQDASDQQEDIIPDNQESDKMKEQVPDETESETK